MTKKIVKQRKETMTIKEIGDQKSLDCFTQLRSDYPDQLSHIDRNSKF